MADTKPTDARVDELERRCDDLQRRLQQLENRDAARQRTAHFPPPRGLRSDKERPGAALGVDTSLGPYAEFNEEDGA